MTTRFEVAPDKVYFRKDGADILDTDAYPVQFFPTASEIVLTGQTLAFPDFSNKGNAYAYSRGVIGSDVYVGCRSYVTIGPEEWSDEEVVGEVPAGTDVLMVMIKLTRTNAPSQIGGQDVPVIPKEGEYTLAPGGSLLLEFKPPMARMLEIYIDGTDVKLRLKQSVKYTNYSYWRAGNDANNTGWTYGGSAGAQGHAVYQLQSLGPTFDLSGNLLKRGQPSQCSLTDTSDFASTYSADIRILPGKSNIESTIGSGAGLPQVVLIDTIYGTSPGSISRSVDTLGAAPTRRAVIAIGYDDTSESVNISAVSLGGVSGTSRVHRRFTSGSLARGIAYYTVELPSTDGAQTLSVTWSGGNPNNYIVETFITYDLTSATPVDTIDHLLSGGADLTQDISISADGIIFAMTRAAPTVVGTLTNIENAVDYDQVSLPQAQWSRGYEAGVGSGTRSITTANLNSNMPFVGLSLR